MQPSSPRTARQLPTSTAESDRSRRPSARDTAATPGGIALTEAEYRAFRDLLYEEAGIALGDTKHHLVASRLSKRLRNFGFTSYSQYYDYVTTQDQQGHERRQLINSLTTNKTDFFRENHHFEFLRDQVIAAIRQRANHGGPRTLRIWSSASSSGEEPYSIAITVKEAFGTAVMGWDVKILASDIDTDILRRAEAGIYDSERIEGVPSQLKSKYFLRGTGKQAGLVRVRPELQSLITFRQINLVHGEWPIRTKFDVIFCRNVIIYFDQETQRRLFTRMANFLQDDGYLMIGHSESLLGMSDVFTPLRGTIYQLRKKDV